MQEERRAKQEERRAKQENQRKRARPQYSEQYICQFCTTKAITLKGGLHLCAAHYEEPKHETIHIMRAEREPREEVS